jgi:hypothetical protein
VNNHVQKVLVAKISPDQQASNGQKRVRSQVATQIAVFELYFDIFIKNRINLNL